jgi:lysyl-tRNA synthetase class II
LRTRSAVVSALRRELEDMDFMEVETPVLQVSAPGERRREAKKSEEV